MSPRPAFLVSFMTMLWTLCPILTSSSYIVEAPAGRFQGMEMAAQNGQKYVGFQGIPFAKPPVGDLRLAKPVPYPKIENTFDATVDMASCPQPDDLLYLNMGLPGKEDCLVLSVYAKELVKDPRVGKKVLVSVHGGGFILGSGSIYIPGTFVTEQDVIVVIINYRLGILGFLSMENEVSPGNFGLWDQALAIQWVKDNIASFGGDPDDIAITGESAGGASVSYLSISPVTKGLFTKVYPMSGTATSVFGNAQDPQFAALRFAKGASCWDGETNRKISAEESQEVVKCLRELPLPEFTKFSDFSFDKAEFAPCVDGDFVPQLPRRLISDEQYLESLGFYEKTYLFGFDNSENAIMAHYLELTEDFMMNMENKTTEEKSGMISKVKTNAVKFYLRTRLGIAEPSQSLIDKVMDWYDRRFGNDSQAEFVTDLSFLIPTYDMIDALARNRNTKVYFLYFNHYPAYMKGKYRGTPHGADMLYWFDFDFQYVTSLLQVGIEGDMDAEDLELRSTFSALVGDFVNTGEPDKTLKAKMPSGWPMYDQQGSHYLNFGPQPTIRRHLQEDRKQLWMKTIPEWAAQLQNEHPSHTEL